MIKRNPLIADRVRKIGGSFAFIEHRFLRNGFWASLGHHELLLYLFLILAADRQAILCTPGPIWPPGIQRRSVGLSAGRCEETADE